MGEKVVLPDITWELIQIITCSSSSHSQRMIILHSTFDRLGQGGIIEPITSHLFPCSSPSATLLPVTWQTCKWSCQYRPRLHSTAPNPANKSCPFAEIGGCDLGWLSNRILLLLSHSGDSTDISTKGWEVEGEGERFMFGCIYSWDNKNHFGSV